MTEGKVVEYQKAMRPTDGIIKKAVELEKWLVANTKGPEEGVGVLALVMLRMKLEYGIYAEAQELADGTQIVGDVKVGRA